MATEYNQVIGNDVDITETYKKLMAKLNKIKL